MIRRPMLALSEDYWRQVSDPGFFWMLATASTSVTPTGKGHRFLEVPVSGWPLIAALPTLEFQTPRAPSASLAAHKQFPLCRRRLDG
jgi:hypothetical protein